MKGMYNHLERKFPHQQLRMVYTTEENGGKDGYHNHFVAGGTVDLPLDKVTAEISRYLEPIGGRYKAKLEIEPIESWGNFLDYIVKFMDKNPEGWDFIFP